MSRRVLLLAASVLIAACSGGGGGDDPPPATRVRAIHASADAPAVDVLFGADMIAANTTFRQASPFSTIYSGAKTLRVNRAGTQTTVLTVQTNLDFNRAVSAIVVGSAVVGAPANQALAAVLIDDDGAAPVAGNAKLRVMHGAPALPAVDIYVTAPGAVLPATPTIAALAYGSVAPVSGAFALRVPAGSYRIRVTPAAQPATLTFDSGSVAVTAGSDLMMVAVPDNRGAAPISLIVASMTSAATEIVDAR